MRGNRWWVVLCAAVLVLVLVPTPSQAASLQPKYSKTCNEAESAQNVVMKYQVVRYATITLGLCYTVTEAGNTVLNSWRVLGPKKVKHLSWLEVHVQNPLSYTDDTDWRFAKVKKGERKWVNLPDGGVVCYGPCSVVITGQAKIPRWPDPTFHLVTHTG